MSTQAELAAAINLEVESRLAGRVADEALHLFNVANNDWEPDPDVAEGEFLIEPNVDCWVQPLRSQLSGIMIYSQYGAGYGITPITARHGICCGHNGPKIGNKAWWADVDGNAHINTVAQLINDHPWISQNECSDTKQAYNGYDVTIYRMAEPFADWVNIFPVANVSMTSDGLYGAGYPVNRLSVSQGHPYHNYQDLGGWWATPNWRKFYVEYGPLVTGNLTEFRHNVSPGDSGSPRFILCNGILYLDSILSGVGCLSDPTILAYVNSLIARSQAAAGDPVEYVVTAAALPQLPVAAIPVRKSPPAVAKTGPVYVRPLYTIPKYRKPVFLKP